MATTTASRGSRALAAFTLALAIVAGAVSLLVVVTGGLRADLFGLELRARSAGRPAVMAVLALGLFVRAYGLHRVIGLGERATRALAISLAGAVLIVGVAGGTGVAGGSDSYGYLSQAELWRSGLPIVPQTWALQVPWPNGEQTFTPLGYGPAAWHGALVPSYAPGLPLLMAAARAVGGHVAMFLIVPLAGAALVLVTYAIGVRLGSAAAAIAGAWLVATSSTLLSEVTAPMSDVLAAAALSSSCFLILHATRRGIVAGGLAAALGVLVRPNLAPAAAVMTLWLAARRSPGGRRKAIHDAAAFALAAAPAFLAAALLNWRLYGSPLVSGYGSLDSLYHWGNVLPNLQRYTSLLTANAPFALLGFAACLLPLKWIWPQVASRSMLIAIGVFVVAIAAPYLAYEPATGGGYLRFLLPCWPFVMVAAAHVVLRLARARWATGVAAFAVAAYGVVSAERVLHAGDMQGQRSEHRYPAAAALARTRTEPSSVIFSDQHSGSVRYYAGRMTVRYDMLDPAWLDRAVAWLAEHGAHPYALLDDGEVKAFRKRFAGQKGVAALDVPVFIYRGAGVVHFCDLLRTGDEPGNPEWIVDRFDGPHFPPPVPMPPFRFGQ